MNVALGIFVSILLVAIGPSAPAAKAGNARAEPVDFGTLYAFAKLAAAAYDDTDALRTSWPGIDRVATPGQTHVRYILDIDERAKTQTIAVRGTVDDTNWDLNKDTRGIYDDKAGILMHAGFNTAARAVYRDLKPHLAPDYVTYLTGHSLGGAVAGVLATYLLDDGIQVGGVYTFGQPKFTNAAGAAAYGKLPVVRVIYQNDVVALLPDRTKGDGKDFAHIGPVVNLLSGPYYLFLNSGATSRLSPGSFRKFRRLASVPDHKMKRYLKSLREKLDGARAIDPRQREAYITRHRPIGWRDEEPIKRKFNYSPNR